MRERLGAPQGKKRFFECKRCRNRDSCVTAYPSFDCGKCGARDWGRSTMHRARDAQQPGSGLLVRGEEQGRVHFMAVTAYKAPQS